MVCLFVRLSSYCETLEKPTCKIYQECSKSVLFFFQIMAQESIASKLKMQLRTKIQSWILFCLPQNFKNKIFNNMKMLTIYHTLK